MGSRRRYLFVLLFVLGLVIVSGLVIAKKETKLGLDLQGGLELVYQGQPTGTATSVSGEDIDDSIGIIERRINKLGVSEPEVARLGTDEITVSLPGITDAARAAEQVGTTAQLYFFDWEPNLIGPEKAIGGRPGQQPPEGALKASEKRWEEAGRNVKSAENQQLIFAGAYPTAYEAALLASEQEPDTKCENCTVAKPRYYLFEKDEPHKLLAGPEQSKADLYVSPTGEEDPQRRDRRRNPRRHPAGLRIPDRQLRPARRNGAAGLVRAEGQPGALGHRHHQPRTDLRPQQRTAGQLRIHRPRPRRFPGSNPPDRPARPGLGDRAGRRRRSGGALRALRRRPRQRSPVAADHQLPGKPRRDRWPQRRPDLRRLQHHRRGAGTGDDAADRRPAGRTETDQRDPGLGDPGLAGARRRDQGRDHRPRPGHPLPARSTTASSA